MDGESFLKGTRRAHWRLWSSAAPPALGSIPQAHTLKSIPNFFAVSAKPHLLVGCCKARQARRGAPRTRCLRRTTTTSNGGLRTAHPLPEPRGNMAAPEEPGSATEAPQPALEEEEAKTFKDLVRVDDTAFFSTPGARRGQRP